MISSNGDSKTEYKATGAPNYGRLSGTTLSKMKFKVSSKIKGNLLIIQSKVSFGGRRIPIYLEKNFGATRGWHKKGQKKGKKTVYRKASRFYYGNPTGAASKKRRNKLFQTEFNKLLKS